VISMIITAKNIYLHPQASCNIHQLKEKLTLKSRINNRNI